jgi:predicted transcriptional regulator
MSKNIDEKDNKVVVLRPVAARSANDKWGKDVMKQGFCIVPSILLRAQPRLGLNPTQLAVLLQLCDYWWDNRRKPYPSKESIGERLGLKGRQVQRYMAELETAGLLKRNERYAANGGRMSNEYDLSGLVEKLQKIAPEFEQAKEVKRQASRRGGLKATAAEQKKA